VQSHWRTLDDRLAELFTAGAYEMVGAAFDAFDSGLLAAAKAEYERQREAVSDAAMAGLAMASLHYSDTELAGLRVLLKPGERPQRIELRYVETNQNRQIGRPQMQDAARPTMWTNDASWASQFISDSELRTLEAAANTPETPAGSDSRNYDLPRGIRQ
jgi:hypothetical protein